MDSSATTLLNDFLHLQLKNFDNIYIDQDQMKKQISTSPSFYAEDFPKLFNGLGTIGLDRCDNHCDINICLIRCDTNQCFLYGFLLLYTNHNKVLKGPDTKKNKLLQESRPIGPIQLFNAILKTWRLDESHAIVLLGLDPDDQGYAADLLAGRKEIKGRDIKDRLAYLIQIRMTLAGWFRNEVVENEWLQEPQKLLDGKVPMELLLEGSMENLLLVKEYVQAATGW